MYSGLGGGGGRRGGEGGGGVFLSSLLVSRAHAGCTPSERAALRSGRGVGPRSRVEGSGRGVGPRVRPGGRAGAPAKVAALTSFEWRPVRCLRPLISPLWPAMTSVTCLSVSSVILRRSACFDSSSLVHSMLVTRSGTMDVIFLAVASVAC